MLGFRDSDSQRGSRSSSSNRSSRSNVSRMSDYLDDGRDSGSSGRRRSSTGNNPGTVLDPEHDGRLHHGDQEFGLSGERLESYDEWIDSHHVPHPGAQGNQNAAGPHNIPPESMERIREGGRRGGEAHRGMRFERTDDGSNSRSGSRSSRSGSSRSSGSGSRSSRSSNSGGSNRNSSSRSSMSSRSTGKGMNTSKRRNSQSQQSNSQGSEGGLVRDLQEAREMANRLDEILSRIAG